MSNQNSAAELHRELRQEIQRLSSRVHQLQKKCNEQVDLIKLLRMELTHGGELSVMMTDQTIANDVLREQNNQLQHKLKNVQSLLQKQIY